MLVGSAVDVDGRLGFWLAFVAGVFRCLFCAGFLDLDVDVDAGADASVCVSASESTELVSLLLLE